MDIEKLQVMIRENIGDLTFREAYLRTKRILNITIASDNCHESSRLLNYLTAPDVLIWSAASASCALTGLYEPVELMAKTCEGKFITYHPSPLKWSDGSVTADLPMVRLGELFNVNHFIVSQVNPHVVPFVHSSREEPSQPSLYGRLRNVTYQEAKHRLHQISDLGLLPSSLEFLNLLTRQKYLGDINVVPRFTYSDYMHLLSNPTQEWTADCTRKSERNTWELMSMITGHCQIGMFLDDAVYALRSKLADDPDMAMDVLDSLVFEGFNGSNESKLLQRKESK